MIVLVGIPVIASASWWNPLTWFQKDKIEQPISSLPITEEAHQPIPTVAPKPKTGVKEATISDTETWQAYSTWFQKNITIPEYSERLKRTLAVCDEIENIFKPAYPSFKKYPYCSDGTNSDGTTKKSYLEDRKSTRLNSSH